MKMCLEKGEFRRLIRKAAAKGNIAAGAKGTNGQNRNTEKMATYDVLHESIKQNLTRY